jgi:tripartite-type tricarboxylate transporter receptor subunit TctC
MRIIPTRLMAAALVLLSAGAAAQAFPSKPIKFVIPSTAGSGMEASYRPVAEHMTDTLGQNVILDMRPGAGGTVASQFVKAQPPDGYTIYLATNQLTVKSVVPNAQVDIRRDFTPIAPTAYSPFIIAVNAEQIKATTLQELIAEAKSRPGQINYASYGIGSGAHMLMAMILNEAKVSMVHVPYQGTAQAVADTVGGRTQVTVSIVGAFRPYVASLGGSGKLRMLAVGNAERSPLVPDLPGMRESGFADIDYIGWGGIVGPAGMRRDVVDKLNGAINLASRDPRLQNFQKASGTLALNGTPEELARIIDREYNAYTKLIQETGLKLE